VELGKPIYIISGRVYDVAVDIRRGSPWFGKYVGVVFEPGYAQGFQVLEESSGMTRR
jgi:dTDP-4-dehydrorhamnose 3,5-epimerase